MTPAGPFELRSQRLKALPIVDRFLERMGVQRMLDRHLPAGDERVSLPAASVIGVLVRNLCLEREPGVPQLVGMQNPKWASIDRRFQRFGRCQPCAHARGSHVGACICGLKAGEGASGRRLRRGTRMPTGHLNFYRSDRTDRPQPCAHAFSTSVTSKALECWLYAQNRTANAHQLRNSGEPLYGLAAWARSFEPGLAGLQPGEAALLQSLAEVDRDLWTPT